MISSCWLSPCSLDPLHRCTRCLSLSNLVRGEALLAAEHDGTRALNLPTTRQDRLKGQPVGHLLPRTPSNIRPALGAPERTIAPLRPWVAEQRTERNLRRRLVGV